MASLSVLDYYRPNPREEFAVARFLDRVRPRDPEQMLVLPMQLPAYLGILSAVHQVPRPEGRQLLVLPTGTQRARRFLRTLCSRAPKEVRNMVVVNGDAIGFNNVFRDRDLAWNVQDLPLPLVFFAHRDPIDAAAGFGSKRHDMIDRSSTQDLLLFRDVFEALVLAGFDGNQLADSADVVRDRLRRTVWREGHVFPGNDDGRPFFDPVGNRTPMTGEHVVALIPHFEGTRVLPEAELTLWQPRADATWDRVDTLQLDYDRRSPPGDVHEVP